MLRTTTTTPLNQSQVQELSLEGDGSRLVHCEEGVLYSKAMIRAKHLDLRGLSAKSPNKLARGPRTMLPTLVPLACSSETFPLLLSETFVVDWPIMALSAHLPCRPAQMFAQEVWCCFTLLPSHGNDALLLLLSFSLSLCTLLICLLLLHVDRSDL